MTICHRDGGWSDNSSDCGEGGSENCSKPNDEMKALQQIGFRVFEAPDQQVSIWDHIEWDKAPRQHLQGKSRSENHYQAYESKRGKNLGINFRTSTWRRRWMVSVFIFPMLLNNCDCTTSLAQV